MVRSSLKENRETTYHSFSLFRLCEGIKRVDYDSGHPAECSSYARFAPLQLNVDLSQGFQPAKQCVITRWFGGKKSWYPLKFC